MIRSYGHVPCAPPPGMSASRAVVSPSRRALSSADARPGGRPALRPRRTMLVSGVHSAFADRGRRGLRGRARCVVAAAPISASAAPSAPGSALVLLQPGTWLPLMDDDHHAAEPLDHPSPAEDEPAGCRGRRSGRVGRGRSGRAERLRRGAGTGIGSGRVELDHRADPGCGQAPSGVPTCAPADASADDAGACGGAADLPVPGSPGAVGRTRRVAHRPPGRAAARGE